MTAGIATDAVSDERDAGRTWPLAYEGSGLELFGLAFKVGLLTVLTLGIYRFWAKTRLRRYLWSAIRVNDSSLEYHGRGSELLIGFLIAIAILAPLSIGYGILAEMVFGPDSPGRAIVDLMWGVLLLTLYGAAIFRMTRYRLSRTSWRGIRFGLDGSTLEFARIFFGYTFLTALTFGITYPVLRRAMVGYRIDHARFGKTPFSFHGTAGPLFGPWLVFLASLVIPFIILIVTAAPATVSGEDGGGGTRLTANAWLALPFALLAPVLFIRYRVREFRHFAHCSKLGTTRLVSEARTRPVALAALATMIASLVILAILLSAVAGMVQGAIPAGGEGAESLPIGPLALVAALMVLAFFAIFPAINFGIFISMVTRHLCATTTIENPEGLEMAARSAVPGPQYGEGLADAFDIGAI